MKWVTFLSYCWSSKCFTEGKRMCSRLKRLLWCPKDNVRVQMIRPGKRTGPRRGGNAEPGGFVTVLFGKQVPFLQRLYSCLPLWIAFLLPLVCKWRENTTSCVSSTKRRKKNWKETSDSDLWHSFLANRGKNQDE